MSGNIQDRTTVSVAYVAKLALEIRKKLEKIQGDFIPVNLPIEMEHLYDCHVIKIIQVSQSDTNRKHPKLEYNAISISFVVVISTG